MAKILVFPNDDSKRFHATVSTFLATLERCKAERLRLGAAHPTSVVLAKTERQLWKVYRMAVEFECRRRARVMNAETTTKV